MMEMKAGSNLEKVLMGGHFAVTVELGPPKGADISIIKRKAEFLRGKADAVNITDCQTAVPRMSSISAAAILVQMGIEPVMQMTCRDRNRIAMQSDMFGASALGIKNMLSISGDHQSFGSQKNAKKVYDLDSIQLIGLVKRLRDEKKMLGDEDVIQGDVPMFIGAAANPFAPPVEFRALLLKKKIDAGADFVQTQCIFDIEKFREWMKIVCDMGLDKKCSILAGIMPLKSPGMAKYMANSVPGITIPDHVLKRMEGVSKEKAAQEGIAILCELIEQMKEIKGIAGVHIMAIEWEHKIPEIMERAKLLPRPVV
jgi:methylenetetrahydrofolate reductase (NADPH)